MGAASSLSAHCGSDTGSACCTVKTGAIHAPTGGDPQALIFNITHLRNGVPTYVIAWEDIDSGSPLRDTYAPGFTDNDYNDLVVEIRANSPVKTEEATWGELKSRFGQ